MTKKIRSILESSSILKEAEINGFIDFLQSQPRENQEVVESLLGEDIPETIAWLDAHFGRLSRAIAVGNRPLARKYLDQLIGAIEKGNQAIKNALKEERILNRIAKMPNN